MNYEQAKGFALNGKLVRRVVTEKSMPPPGSPQASSITEDERQLIGQWATNGAPQVTVSTPGTNRGKSPVAGASDGAPSAAAAGQASGDASLNAALNPSVFAPAQQCLQCHASGRASADDVNARIPRLAGQNAEYLVEQLRKFRWYERIDPTNTMNEIAGRAEMNEETVRKISEYFAGIVRPPVKEAAVQPARQREFDQGKMLAIANCVQCHANPDHKIGTSDPGVPNLWGQPEIYLRNRLLNFRASEQPSPLMHEYARLLKNADVDALALYFSRY
jgi:cytochrome c553